MIATKCIVKEAMAQALETMAFLTVEPVNDDTVVPAETVLTEMRFRGPHSGILRIMGSPQLGAVLAENIGCVPNPDREAVADAWKEVCNVTCGLVIPRVAGATGEVCDVTVPAVRAGERAPAWRDFTDSPDCDVVSVEGHAAAVRRLLHKIKGESGMVGFTVMERLFHEAENAFEELPRNRRSDMLLRLKDWVLTVLSQSVGEV